MKNNIDLFYRRMKENLTESPSAEIDNKILTMASKKLKPDVEPSLLSQWLKPSLAIAFSVALVIIINIKSNNRNNTNKLLLTESPEMVLNYKDIELMADAGALSEEDWKRIEVAGVAR